MRKWIFDIEANGLLDTIHTIYMVVFKELGKDNFQVFTDSDPKYSSLAQMPDWVENNVDCLIAHNGVRYDLPALKKVLGYEPPKSVSIIDTLIVSRMNDWPNKKLHRKHSLAAWGNYLGFPKGDFKDFEGGYSEEMLEYCKQDCVVNEAVYRHVMNDASNWIAKYPNYRDALRMEHDMAHYVSEQTTNGWLFDFEGAERLVTEITAKMKHIEESVEPHLGDIVTIIDKEPKKPQYKKNGEYTIASARVIGDYLGYEVSPEDALKAEPPIAPGTEIVRTKTTPAGMGQQESVKTYLEKLGIVWTEWNWKKEGGEFIKTGPKLNDGDIKRIGHPHADMIADYYTLRSRRSILNGWLEQKGGDGRLRGDVMDLGTATGRHSHKIIANIPNGNAVYGEEFRRLFICPEDKTIISADGAAYQLRILAHYLKDEGYVDTVLNGDIHQRHADAMGITRAQAKPVAFGILYGAGGGKVASMLGSDPATGTAVRNSFIKNIPNLEKLNYKVMDVAKLNGWIPGLDGRKVYTEEPYKALNYLIQSAEAIMMKNTIVQINQAFEDNGIEAKQLLMYHDECSWEIDPANAKRAEDIIRHCFHEAPKKFGVDIMEAGDVKVGKDYYEVH